jgi:hypothetical protein
MTNEQIVEHFEKTLSWLKKEYFSYHWDQAERVVEVNLKYVRYVSNELIPATLKGEAMFKEAMAPHSKWTFKELARAPIDKYSSIRKWRSTSEIVTRLHFHVGETFSDGGDGSEHPPNFIFLGGGPASGKTTIANALKQTEWWRAHEEYVVWVDSDRFKTADPIHGFLRFSSCKTDVHKQSTKNAELLLINALNQGRSVVFDGTMTCAPFVEQTVAMIRDAHEYLYAMGPGYDEASGVEQYWIRQQKRERPLEAAYRIHLLAITVEPQEAVPRGIMRAMSTGRSVPIRGQLRSFRLFSQNFKRYLQLCDEVTLFNNNVRVDLEQGELPPVILQKPVDAVQALGVGWLARAGVMSTSEPPGAATPVSSGEVMILDKYAYEQFLKHRHINDNARNRDEMYTTSEPMASSETDGEEIYSSEGVPLLKKSRLD